MKKIVLCILFGFMFNFIGYSQQDQKIGIVKDGKFIITENIDNIKEDWSMFLKNSKIDCVLTTFEIREKQDNENPNEKYYFLIGLTKSSDVKVVQLLELDQYGIFKMAPKHTVTCSGCTIGCSPDYVKRVKMWICADSCGSQCSKSETVSN